MLRFPLFKFKVFTHCHYKLSIKLGIDRFQLKFQKLTVLKAFDIEHLLQLNNFTNFRYYLHHHGKEPGWEEKWRGQDEVHQAEGVC